MWKRNYDSEERKNKWKPWLGIIIVIICGFGMLLFVWNLSGRQVTKEVDFFLEQTSENLDGKLEYLDSVIYALRDNTAFMERTEKTRRHTLKQLKQNRVFRRPWMWEK